MTTRMARDVLAVFLGVVLTTHGLRGGDWPQWGGTACKNMVSLERNLPETFVPGSKSPQGSGLLMSTTKNVKWAARIGDFCCGTPAVADGRVFLAGMIDSQGIVKCFDEAKEPTTLKTTWWVDCIPPEYRSFGGLEMMVHYTLGDKRRKDTLNKLNDGSFVGMSEIIATPVFHKGRVYVAIGRDPDHGRGRGALVCLDANQNGTLYVASKKYLWAVKN
jgi:hypothetical protein